MCCWGNIAAARTPHPANTAIDLRISPTGIIGLSILDPPQSNDGCHSPLSSLKDGRNREARSEETPNRGEEPWQKGRVRCSWQCCPTVPAVQLRHGRKPASRQPNRGL